MKREELDELRARLAQPYASFTRWEVEALLDHVDALEEAVVLYHDGIIAIDRLRGGD